MPRDPESSEADTAGHAVTEALAALNHGAPDAMDRLIPIVYEQLRRIAHRQLGSEATGHTLSTTGLVHEAWLKLANQRRAKWQNRAQFFAIAAGAMRRVLVDYARRHRAARRGGGAEGAASRTVSLDAVDVPATVRADAIVALDEALDRLAGMDTRLAQIVECRFFAGLTEAETAVALGVSQRTVARGWAVARAWLHQELRGDAG